MPDHHARDYDVLIIGDEVESVLTAVSAGKAGAKTGLLRRSTGLLGGLSTRGGLSYMDITVEMLTGLFHEFYRRAGVVRIALNPGRTHDTLSQMLAEAGVDVFSGIETRVQIDRQGFPDGVLLNVLPTTLAPGLGQGEETTRQLNAKVVIDATPDADVARALGVPYLKGLGGLLGDDQNFLGVSPVFRITGVPVAGLQAFEASLRQNPGLPRILEQALPYHPADLREAYLTRPTFAPDDQDYLDILNPVIGIDYHLWRHSTPSTYPTAAIAIDGGNISRLADGSLGFNGLVARADALGLQANEIFERLVSLSQGGPTPASLLEEMRQFETYLREKGNFPQAQVIPPQELYVRQTLTLLARQNMTARDAVSGGVSPEQAVGTFSYWLDLRGAQLWKRFPGQDLPKPVFNVGLNVALPLTPALQNFAFVSRSAGYSPIGQGTGRIVQHNAMLGEGLGVAAALAALDQTTLTDIVDNAMPQVQAILAARRGGTLNLSGYATWTAEQISESELLKQDAAAVEALRAAATDFSTL